MRKVEEYKRELEYFEKTVDTLINIGLDNEIFMNELDKHDFTVEFMGIKATIPFGADSWSSLTSLLHDIKSDLDLW